MSKNEKSGYVKPSIDLLEDGKKSLRGFIESKRFLEKGNGVDLCLGLTNDGEKYIEDLTKMPHLLVAGASGTGKTVFLNSVIVGLLYKYSPEDVRLVIIDPKGMEFNVYKNIPHLLTPSSIKHYPETIDVFEKLVDEMGRRYEIFEKEKCSNIDEYNQKHPNTKMYKIVVVVDEFVDLMMHSKGSKKFINNVASLAQKASFVGIHMIISTQRPIDEVIPKKIKDNIACRVAFKTMTSSDSQVILNQAGAENLNGFGDMLYLVPSMPSPLRMQGLMVSSSETKSVCDFIRANNS